jgi:hypothetical protein
LDLLNFHEAGGLLIEEVIDFFMQVSYLGFGLQVHLVVTFCSAAVAGFLTILAHHNDRGLHGSEAGKNEIEQDEGIGIKTFVRKKERIECRRRFKTGFLACSKPDNLLEAESA